MISDFEKTKRMKDQRAILKARTKMYKANIRMFSHVMAKVQMDDGAAQVLMQLVTEERARCGLSDDKIKELLIGAYL